MKIFRIKGLFLEFEGSTVEVEPELIVGKIVEKGSTLVRVNRYARRGLGFVWYYTVLGEAEEHYTAKLSSKTRVVVRTFKQGWPLIRIGEAIHQRDGEGTFHRPDALVPVDALTSYVGWLADCSASERFFIRSLATSGVSPTFTEVEDFLRIKETLGARECPICGRLHAGAGEMCMSCAEDFTMYMVRTTSGAFVPKAFCVKLPDGSTRACWEAEGLDVICPQCGKRYKLTSGGVNMCASCADAVKVCMLCGAKIDTRRPFISVEGVGYAHTECAAKPVMDQYHSNRSHNDPVFMGTPAVASFPLYMGIELEGARKETGREQCPALASAIVKKNLKDLNVETTRDGSLPGGGIEIISQPMTIEKWRETMPIWKDTLALLPKHTYIYGHDARCAGLHVHVSKKAFESYTPICSDPEFRVKVVFGRLIVLFARFQEQFLYISRRSPSRKSDYARTLVCSSDLSTISDERFQVEFARLRERTLESSGHYTELNIQPARTLEFRLFRSTFNTETLMATLEFVNGLCWFVANNSMDACRTVSFDDLIASIGSPVLTSYVGRVMHGRSHAQDDRFEGEA